MQAFGKWGPDSATLNVQLAGEASGVLPGRTGYTPWPSMAVGSAALATACRGAYMARTLTNASAIFAGTSTKLNKFASMSAWSDFSKVGGYHLGTDDQWQYAQYGPNVYATNIADTLQSCDVSSGSIFADVAGSPPKAKYIAVVGDFLMLGNTDSSGREVRWCSRNDPTTWTRYQRDADSQQFPDGGDVMGLSGLEQGGLILQTDAVRSMTVRSDAAIMEFHRIEAAQGTLAPYSLVCRGGTAYYYATNGWQQILTDGTSQGIGSNWVDQWFLDNSNAASRPKAIIGSFTSRSPKIVWLFAAPGNSTSQIFDHALCFDPTLTGDNDYGPWTHAPMVASTIFSSGTTGVSLDGLGTPGLGYAIDAVPYSLDSDVWKGGVPRMGAFDDAFRMNFFSGPPQAAVMQTGLFSPVPGSRGFVNGFRPVVDAATVTGRIATTERQQTPETWGSPGTLTDQGIVYKRTSGRHMRFEVAIPAGTIWQQASGISIEDDAGLTLATTDGVR